MRVLYLGCTKFSEEILEHLILQGVDLVGICTIPEYFHISYSKKPVQNTNYADLKIIANVHNIAHFEVDSVEGKKITDYKFEIEALKPDVVLAMGWYYMVPKKIREIATYGAWGVHASLLPKYAGGAPLVWAIIEGQKETGVTLFKFDSGVDDGDIIKQKSFPIEEEDTIKEVYEKATVASKSILKEAIIDENFSFTPQDKTKIEVYPQRRPADGEINWEWDNKRIKNFIRAQTKPYPGAFTIINGKKVTIWEANIENI